jgi:hypothetical protein
LLLQAKCDLSSEQFERMITHRIPFGFRSAERLIKIAAHPVLSDPTHVSRLPASWGTLYQLTTLPEGKLLELLNDGTIHASTQRADVEQIAKSLRRSEHDFAKLCEALIACIGFSLHRPACEAAPHVYNDRKVWLEKLPHLAAWITTLSEEVKQYKGDFVAIEERRRGRKPRPVIKRHTSIPFRPVTTPEENS